MQQERSAIASGHRADLQGLRALAVLLIALHHAGMPGFDGGYVGVDVFFVLSGFLITGQLLRDADESGGMPLAWFYARRARRILPAAALTLLTVNIAAWLLLDPLATQRTFNDSVAAALFVSNWHFAGQTGYFDRSIEESPLLHFWSLGVEEQFYLAWPLVLLALLALGTRYARLGRRAAPFGIWGIVMTSLAWSVHATVVDQDQAFFSTLTRAWELGIGAGLAMAAPRLSTWSSRRRSGAAWLGLAAVGVATLAFSPSTPFPGIAALLPALGSALVIAAGAAPGTTLPARALSYRVATYVGDRSYAFYLWHWPVLVLAAASAGHALPGLARLGLLGAAFALSIVSYAAVEQPIRRRQWSSPRPAVALSALAILPVVVGAAAGAEAIDRRYGTAADTPTIANAFKDGVLAVTEDAAAAARRHDPIPDRLAPALPKLADSVYRNPPGCRPAHEESQSKICVLGDPTAARTVVVFGDSHAQMWMPAALAMARRDGWRVIPIHRGSCPPAAWVGVAQAIKPCALWLPWAIGEIRRLHPDVTLVAGHMYAEPFEPARLGQGLTSIVRELQATSGEVVTIGDRPPGPPDPAACLLGAHADLRTCSIRPRAAQVEGAEVIRGAVVRAGSRWLETRHWLCATDLCPAIIGQTIVMRDDTHLTQAYVGQLEDVFRLGLEQTLAR